MLKADIMDGSISRGEPSMLEVNITEGSISRAEPSTMDTEIVEGPITKSRTIHDNAPYRGWSMMSR